MRTVNIRNGAWHTLMANMLRDDV